MRDDILYYPTMIQRALREVPRQALEAVQQHGLPGAHHFYLSFRTDHPEVVIGEDLKQLYPEEMTIVLQHQFRNLEVDREGFSVTLNFGGRPRNLSIPFAALTVFSDPSVEFGLQFVSSEELEAAAFEEPAADEAVPDPSPQSSPPKDNVVSFDARRKPRPGAPDKADSP